MKYKVLENLTVDSVNGSAIVKDISWIVNYKQQWVPFIPEVGVTNFESTATNQGSPVTSGEGFLPSPATLISKKPPYDQESFRKIRQSGRIKMTDWYRRSEKTEYFIVRVHCDQEDGPRGSYSGRTKGNTFIPIPNKPIRVQYDLNLGFDSLSKLDYLRKAQYAYRRPDSDLLKVTVTEVATSVVADLAGTYDLGTELAELPETLKYAVQLLKSIRKPLKALKKAHKAGTYANAWLQYRYAIMPVVYSIQDTMSVINNSGFQFLTARRKKVIDVNDILVGPEPSALANTVPSVFNTFEGTVTVTAVGKARYDKGKLQRIVDQIRFNPLVTTWELIPFSFVVDWFINVGDYLSALTGSLTDLSDEKRFCYAIKWDYVELTHLKLPNTTRVLELKDRGNNVIQTLQFETRFFQQDDVLKRTIIREYQRKVFVPLDMIGVSFSSFSNISWRRSLDALALSLRPLNKALRRLK